MTNECGGREKNSELRGREKGDDGAGDVGCSGGHEEPGADEGGEDVELFFEHGCGWWGLDGIARGIKWMGVWCDKKGGTRK